MSNRMLFQSGSKVRVIQQLIDAHYAIYGRDPDKWVIRQWNVMNERALQFKLKNLEEALKNENRT